MKSFFLLSLLSLVSAYQVPLRAVAPARATTPVMAVASWCAAKDSKSARYGSVLLKAKRSSLSRV